MTKGEVQVSVAIFTISLIIAFIIAAFKVLTMFAF